MAGQLATVGGALPVTGGSAVVPGAPTASPLPGTNTSAAPASGDAAAQIAALQQLLAVLTELIAVASAQAGAASVAGGGAAAAPGPATTQTAEDAFAGAQFGSFGGGGGAWSIVEPVASIPSAFGIGTAPAAGAAGSVTGGGASLAPALVQTAENAFAGAQFGSFGGGGGAWTIVEPVASIPSAFGVATAPAAAPAGAVAGGGGNSTSTAAAAAAAGRLLGTPQPGGMIDLILRSASPTAAPAKSEGGWTTLVDGNGAQLQAHVHGIYSSQPGLIQAAIQQGRIAVHAHPDGTVHLHDVA